LLTWCSGGRLKIKKKKERRRKKIKKVTRRKKNGGQKEEEKEEEEEEEQEEEEQEEEEEEEKRRSGRKSKEEKESRGRLQQRILKGTFTLWSDIHCKHSDERQHRPANVLCLAFIAEHHSSSHIWHSYKFKAKQSASNSRLSADDAAIFSVYGVEATSHFCS